MADRCGYVWIRFPGNEIEKVTSLFEKHPWLKLHTDDHLHLNEKGDGCLELFDVPAGGQDYADALKEAGIPYEGMNSDGIEYPEALFVWIGDDEDPSQVDVVASDSIPIAAIGRDLTPQPETLDEISRYYRILDKVTSYFESNRGEEKK